MAILFKVIQHFNPPLENASKCGHSARGTLGFGNVVHCPFQYFPCFQPSPWHLNNDEPALFVKANGSAACHFGDVGFASGLRFFFMFSFCAGNSTANMVQYNYYKYVPCTPSLCHPCLMSTRSSWHVSTPLGSRCVLRAPAIPRRTPNVWSRRLGKHQHIRWRSARPSHQSSHCSPILALSAIRGHLTQRCQCRHLCEHWSILHWSPICRLELAWPRSHSSWLCAHKCHEATARTGALQDWRSSQGAQQRVHRVYPCQASGPSCWGYFFRYLDRATSSFPRSSARPRLRLWEARKAKTRATAATCPSRPPWAWEKPQAVVSTQQLVSNVWCQCSYGYTRSEHQMLPRIQTNPRNWKQKLKKLGPTPSWIIYLTTQAEVVRSFYPSSKGFEFEEVSPCWCANFFILSNPECCVDSGGGCCVFGRRRQNKRRRWATNVAWLAWFLLESNSSDIKHPSSYPNPNQQNQQLLRWFRSGTSTDTSLAISWWPLLPPNMPSQRGDNWGGQEAFHMKVRDSHRPWIIDHWVTKNLEKKQPLFKNTTKKKVGNNKQPMDPKDLYPNDL